MVDLEFTAHNLTIYATWKLADRSDDFAQFWIEVFIDGEKWVEDSVNPNKEDKYQISNDISPYFSSCSIVSYIVQPMNSLRDNIGVADSATEFGK
mgnify:CR=1 FL=1